jgi:hypothetical protein
MNAHALEEKYDPKLWIEAAVKEGCCLCPLISSFSCSFASVARSSRFSYYIWRHLHAPRVPEREAVGKAPCVGVGSATRELATNINRSYKCAHG